MMMRTSGSAGSLASFPALSRTQRQCACSVRNCAQAKARTAYQDFLALWKDADPDLPILLAAKSEYAKLK
jgi:hypothetical protein